MHSCSPLVERTCCPHFPLYRQNRHSSQWTGMHDRGLVQGLSRAVFNVTHYIFSIALFVLDIFNAPQMWMRKEPQVNKNRYFIIVDQHHVTHKALRAQKGFHS
jgi:hypothetical protein